MRNDDVIIPLIVLREHDEMIQRALHTLTKTDIEDIPDSATKQAFEYYSLFSDEGLLERSGLPPISREEAFYNEYYWFLIFSKRYQANCGYDGGIEQQAFKLLEVAPSSVDWNRVQEIVDRVKAEP